jgi:uncharacterized protein (UPF0548 family)
MPMIFLRKPHHSAVRDFLRSQTELALTYQAPRETVATLPAGFVVDHTRIRLGQGEPVFQTAKAALGNWRQFSLGWCEAWPPDTPIRVGNQIAIVARALGIWWLNASRIVSVVDELGPVRRFGFTYGTLPAHIETGEERFLLEWDREDDSVWYDILAFSRPRHLSARLGYPWVRRLQKRFARHSAAAMSRAVAAGR